MEHTGITIIGAGIVGLAIASELSKKREIVIIEKHERAGKETSSRNSEIIHAGIYYKKDSLKAKLCVEGKNLLYELCERFNIPHRRTGKLIVAANIAGIPCLERLLAQGQENGVLDLELLTRTQAGRLEPNVNTCGALFSKSTGIVDVHKLMDLFQFQATSNGSIIAYNSEVTGIEKSPSGYVLQIKSGTETCYLASQVVINSAGLHADKLAELAGIDIKASRYKIHFCKGEYFIVRNAKDRIRHLIYPLPEENLRGLGIHATLDLDGELRLGPNAFYVDVIDYDVNPDHRKKFFEFGKLYFPFLREDDLQPGFSGIRPKLQGHGEGYRDFVIANENEKGLPGFINLVGIESPGLTCSPAIARYVKNIIDAVI